MTKLFLNCLHLPASVVWVSQASVLPAPLLSLPKHYILQSTSIFHKRITKKKNVKEEGSKTWLTEASDAEKKTVLDGETLER